MDLLSKCFEILLANKSDMTWKTKVDLERIESEKPSVKITESSITQAALLFIASALTIFGTLWYQ